jgi:hypothetical protein
VVAEVEVVIQEEPLVQGDQVVAELDLILQQL